MLYIYGCPNKDQPSFNPETYRSFGDYLAARQSDTALAAGFEIFDVYGIPQLHAPLAAFYQDVIHLNHAGNRLVAQEFAASVAHPSSRIPRSLSRPIITGIAKVNSTLVVARGSWSFAPGVYTYQWMRDATDIPNATSTSYTATPSDASYHLSCRVTATNAQGSAERTSAHTAKVVP